MKKVLIALTMLVGISMSSSAQSNPPLEVTPEGQGPAKPPLPITPENVIVSNLFSIPDSEVHHRFKVELMKGNYLLIDFRILSDWQSSDSGSFVQIIRTAAQVEDKYRSQMQNSQSSKRLDISIPISSEPVTARYREWNENSNLQVFTANDNAPLKIGMDTIRVVETWMESTMNWQLRGGSFSLDHDGKAQLQYTFLLKDMDYISELAADEEWVRQTAGLLDSIVKANRLKWKRPNRTTHNSYAVVAMHENSKPTISLPADYNRSHLTGGSLHVDAGYGVSLVRNMLAPTIDWGVSLTLPIEGPTCIVQRFSWSNFYLYDKQANNTFKGYVTSMLNYEVGIGSKDRIFGNIGFGVRIFGAVKHYEDDPSVTRDLYRLFFRYAVNRTITVTPELYMVPKHPDQNWVGVTLGIRIY